MDLRVLSRVVVYDAKQRKMLLVKNRGMDFWYAPGGAWEYDSENILECATREVKEEVGIDVKVIKMLYLMEFHATEDTIFFEIFWLANPAGDGAINDQHVDLDPNGLVESAKWFSQEDMKDVKVLPERLKETFWDRIKTISQEENPFIGVH